MTRDPDWLAYMRLLQDAGYKATIGGAWEHKQTGRVIHPHNFGPQPDGTVRPAWRYWADQEYTPPPF